MKEFKLSTLKISLVASAGLLWSVNSYPADDNASIQRNWEPAVLIFGDGDKTEAIYNMSQIANVQDSMLKNSNFDDNTQIFIEDLWASFEKFNLRKLYKILPHQQGDWRFIQIFGSKEGDQYQYRQSDTIDSSNTPHTPQKAGDFAFSIESKEIHNPTSSKAYLIRNDIKLLVHSKDWNAIDNAITETFDIVTQAPDEASSHINEVTRSSIKTRYPDLSKEDLNIVYPIWASFPNCWELFSSVVEVKDVIITPISNKPYKQLNASLALRPDVMADKYKELTIFLENIGSLFNVEMGIKSEDGELYSVHINSDKLTVNFNAFIMDGRLLPVGDDGKVIVNTKTLKPSDAFTADMNIDFELVGVRAKLEDLKSNITYSPNNEEASILTKSNEIPKISVSGNAFGILPTTVIDFFMPSNIESIIKEFMEVVFYGQAGEGVIVDLFYRHDSSENISTIKTNVSFVGIDNFFVRMGMGMVNERIIPSDEASEDLRALWFDTKNAFERDLALYTSAASY